VATHEVIRPVADVGCQEGVAGQGGIACRGVCRAGDSGMKRADRLGIASADARRQAMNASGSLACTVVIGSGSAVTLDV
jgi:hypothetical protein